MSDPGFPVGVVGAGFHASANVLPALRAAGLDVVALATRDRERSAAALAANGFHGTAYGSSDELFRDPAVAGVIVVAQPADQIGLTIAALRAGTPVLVDKPLGRSAAEAARIADEADAAGVQLMVGFMKRYAPVFVRLRNIVETGGLGRIRSFHIRFACDSTGFASSADDFVRLAAIHHVDLVRFLLGEVASVHVARTTVEREIALAALLQTESGAVGTLELAGARAFASEVDQVRVSGDDGWAQVDDTCRLEVHQRQDGDADWRDAGMAVQVLTPAVSTMSGGQQDLYQRGFVGELRAFADAIRDGRPASSSGRDNVATTALCDRLVEPPSTSPTTP